MPELEITQFISLRNVGLEDALMNVVTKQLDNSTGVIVRPSNDYEKAFFVKIDDKRHDYVDGAKLAAGWYRYIGVQDFQNSRIHAFEEVQMPVDISFKDVFGSSFSDTCDCEGCKEW